MFYHIKNLQSTKTYKTFGEGFWGFYHIKNLQSTKTTCLSSSVMPLFYHIKNLQSTKTGMSDIGSTMSFITLRIYKVLKPQQRLYALIHS